MSGGPLLTLYLPVSLTQQSQLGPPSSRRLPFETSVAHEDSLGFVLKPSAVCCGLQVSLLVLHLSFNL